MAVNKNNRVVRFELNDEDYNAFGRYRIMYTAQGRRMVNRQRLTYLISGICIAVLFTVFHVDPSFTKLAYAVAFIIGVGGTIMAERIILRQQKQSIEKGSDTLERIHPTENVVRFDEETFETKAGEDAEKTLESLPAKIGQILEKAAAGDYEAVSEGLEGLKKSLS